MCEILHSSSQVKSKWIKQKKRVIRTYTTDGGRERERERERENQGTPSYLTALMITHTHTYIYIYSVICLYTNVLYSEHIYSKKRELRKKEKKSYDMSFYHFLLFLHFFTSIWSKKFWIMSCGKWHYKGIDT